MKLLCPKCRVPLDYASETQRCESCGWQSKARPYAHLRIPESNAVWVDTAQIPEVFRPAYDAVQKQLSSGGPFLSCALTLSPLIQQLISLPVLIGGSLLGSGAVLPLSPSIALSGWIRAMDLLLSKTEVRSHPPLESLLSETLVFARQADAHPFLSGGMFSLSYTRAKRNLTMLLKASGQLLLSLSEPYRKIKLRPASGSNAGLQFTLDGKKYPLQGTLREGETLFLLTHGLGGKIAGCSAVGEARCGVLPLPDFFLCQEKEETVRPFAQIPRNPALLHSVRRATDDGFIKGRILLRTAVEMGVPGNPEPSEIFKTSPFLRPFELLEILRDFTKKAASVLNFSKKPEAAPEIEEAVEAAPESEEKETPEPLLIVYDARESRLDGAAALFRTVSELCRPDAALLDSLEVPSSDTLLTLLTRLKKDENRSILLLIANADDYTDFTFPLDSLLPETDRLPDGVVLVLHSADQDFSLSADLDIDLAAEDADQRTFLYDFLYRRSPFLTLTPKKREEETEALLAAAPGSFPPVFLYTAFGSFRPRPRKAELLADCRPEKLFSLLTKALYGDFLEPAVQVLSLCHSAAQPYTPAEVMRLFPSTSPWLIRTVLDDLPLLSFYHLSALDAASSDALRALCDRYLSETEAALSPRMHGNRLRAVAAFGTEEQKQALKKNSVLPLSLPAELSEEEASVQCRFYEAVLFSGETRPETGTAARTLLSLYEEEDSVLAWLFAQKLLHDEQADPLTKRAAAVLCASLLFEQGAEKKALSLLEALPSGDSKGSTPEDALFSFRAHALKGEIHSHFNENSKALAALEQALSSLPDDDSSDERNAARAARAHDLCGAILSAKGEPEKALAHFTKAAGLFGKLTHEESETEESLRLASSLIQAADCQSFLELDAEAMENYRRAEALLLPLETGGDALFVRLYLARAALYERNADTLHALKERSRALDFHEKLLRAGEENAEPLCRTLQLAAQDALSLGSVVLALRYLDSALLLTEKMTAAGQRPDPKWLEELRAQRSDARNAAGSAPNTAEEQAATQEPDPPQPSKKSGFPLKFRKSGGENVPVEPSAPKVPLEELRLRSKTAADLLKEKDYADAIDTLLPLLDLLENLPPEEEAEALQTLALSYVGAQRTEEGMPSLERLVKRLETVPLSKSLLDAHAHVFSSMGMVYRTRRKNEKALESYCRAIELWLQGQRSAQSIDKNRLASAYVNRAVLLTERKQFGRAVEDLKKAIALREELGSEDQNGLARLYLNLGYVYGQYGEMHHALAYNRKAAELRAALYRQGEISAAELARSYLNLGILLGGDKQVDGEIENYGLAIDLLESREEQTPEDRGLLVKLYRYRAMSYQLQDLPDKQKSDLERADKLEALTRR